MKIVVIMIVKGQFLFCCFRKHIIIFQTFLEQVTKGTNVLWKRWLLKELLFETTNK